MTRARAFRTAEPYWPPRGTGRLAAEIVAIEARELKWILRIGNRFTHERFRALAHQARVWAVDEHDRSSRAGKEVLDLGDFQRDHEISRSPASHVEAGAARCALPFANRMGSAACVRDLDKRLLGAVLR